MSPPDRRPRLGVHLDVPRARLDAKRTGGTALVDIRFADDGPDEGVDLLVAVAAGPWTLRGVAG